MIKYIDEICKIKICSKLLNDLKYNKKFNYVWFSGL